MEVLDLGPADLAPGELRGFRDGKTWYLVASHAGGLYALDDQCNHAGCLLSTGWLDAERSAVVCPCHEIAFELMSGRNLTVPWLCKDQRVFPLRIEAGRVLLEVS